MIDYKGLRNLSSFEISEVRSLANKFFIKIDRKIKNANLILTIKKYKEKVSRSKYSIHARLEAPHIILVTKQSGWDINLVMNKAFENLRNELIHKFKIEGIKRKPKSITRTRKLIS